MNTRTVNIRQKQQDLVVIGAGMAGLVAAIEAATDAKVTVLDNLGPISDRDESSVSPYGSDNEPSRAAGGGLARFSHRAPAEILLNTTGGGIHYKDPIEEMPSRQIERGGGRVDSSLMRSYLERVIGDCLWLREELKIPYKERPRVLIGSGYCPCFWSCRWQKRLRGGLKIQS